MLCRKVFIFGKQCFAPSPRAVDYQPQPPDGGLLPPFRPIQILAMPSKKNTMLGATARLISNTMPTIKNNNPCTKSTPPS